MAITFADAHATIDALTAAGLAPTPVVYGNTSDSLYQGGTVDYIKQRVIFNGSKQFELGSPTRGRNFGSIVLILHCRRGTGDAGRNALLEKVVSSLRSKQVSGVTTLNARVVTQGEIENWQITGVEIPFYFTVL